MMIYPVRDRVARCPVTRQPVPEEGIEVQATDFYWARALRDGDVKTEPTAKARETEAKTDVPAQRGQKKEG